MTGNDLLHALNDVEEQFIEEAAPKEASSGRRGGSGRPRTLSMKRQRQRRKTPAGATQRRKRQQRRRPAKAMRKTVRRPKRRPRRL